VRLTRVLRELLDVPLFVEEAEITSDGLEIDVRPPWRQPRCGGCARRAPAYDRRATRSWRHVPFGAWRVWLRYAPWRVRCRTCGVTTEHLPWASSTTARFTAALEDMAAYLAVITDKTAVTRLLGISWRAVDHIVERVVEQRLDAKRFDGVRILGIDEFSYRKRHRYLTIVVDHERRRVIWAKRGKSSETLHAFFDEIGEERLAGIQSVTIDMSQAYIKAIRARLPHATIVFDRFHVQQLASDALDQVRRTLVRELDDPNDRRAVKNTRFVVLKNPWNLNRSQRRKLAEIQRSNAPLYRAYLLKESLADALDTQSPARARRKLEEWLAWASRSRLVPFVRVARTVRTHLDGILAYLELRISNGLVEGLNNRIRMIARRAFGFHSAKALIAMIFLTCGDIPLYPPLPSNA